MHRQGKFTLPDLIGALMLTFIFGAAFPVIVDAIELSWAGSNLLTKASLAIIIPGILIAITGYILTSGQPEFQEQPMREPRRRRR